MPRIRTGLVFVSLLLSGAPALAQYYDDGDLPCNAVCRAWIRGDLSGRQSAPEPRRQARPQPYYVESYDDDDDLDDFAPARPRSPSLAKPPKQKPAAAPRKTAQQPAQRPSGAGDKLRPAAAARAPEPRKPAVARLTPTAKALAVDVPLPPKLPRMEAPVAAVAPLQQPTVAEAPKPVERDIVATAPPVADNTPPLVARAPEPVPTPPAVVEAAPVAPAPPAVTEAPQQTPPPAQIVEAPAVEAPPSAMAEDTPAVAPPDTKTVVEAPVVEPTQPPAAVAETPQLPASEPALDRQVVASIPAQAGSSAEIRQVLGLTGSIPNAPLPIGEFVEASVELKPLPAAFKALRPYFGDLLYTVIGDTAVLVYPSTRRVMMTY